MLDIQDLSVTYSETDGTRLPALENVSLQISAGEIAGVFRRIWVRQEHSRQCRVGSVAEASGCYKRADQLPRSRSAISSQKLEPALFENLREIMYVCSQLFVANDGGRVSLDSITMAGQCSSDTTAKIATFSSQKLGMKVSIEGYGDGKASLFS